MVGLREITESEGTAAGALALAGALDIPAPGGVRAQLRPLLRTGSVPRYRPERWNDVAVRFHNNCYNYATDVLNNTYAQPGMGAGLEDVPLDCPGETMGAVADGLLSTGAVEHCNGVEFGHRVALVIAPGLDFHWFRRDRDGMWSHKPGGTPATNLDGSDRVITDPRTADRGRYTEFCGFFCVPRGAVSVIGPLGRFGAAAAAVPPNATVVRLLVFSGRPDPEWILDPDEERAVLAKLRTTATRPRLTSARRTASRLGYRGFLVDRPGATPGTRDVRVIGDGLVSDVRLTSHRSDADGLEADLLAQARARGFGDLVR